VKKVNMMYLGGIVDCLSVRVQTMYLVNGYDYVICFDFGYFGDLAFDEVGVLSRDFGLQRFEMVRFW
jgi:hypothetical protein